MVSSREGRFRGRRRREGGQVPLPLGRRRGIPPLAVRASSALAAPVESLESFCWRAPSGNGSEARERPGKSRGRLDRHTGPNVLPSRWRTDPAGSLLSPERGGAPHPYSDDVIPGIIVEEEEAGPLRLIDDGLGRGGGIGTRANVKIARTAVSLWAPLRFQAMDRAGGRFVAGAHSMTAAVRVENIAHCLHPVYIIAAASGFVLCELGACATDCSVCPPFCLANKRCNITKHPLFPFFPHTPPSLGGKHFQR